MLLFKCYGTSRLTTESCLWWVGGYFNRNLMPQLRCLVSSAQSAGIKRYNQAQDGSIHILLYRHRRIIDDCGNAFRTTVIADWNAWLKWNIMQIKWQHERPTSSHQCINKLQNCGERGTFPTLQFKTTFYCCLCQKMSLVKFFSQLGPETCRYFFLLFKKHWPRNLKMLWNRGVSLVCLSLRPVGRMEIIFLQKRCPTASSCKFPTIVYRMNQAECVGQKILTSAEDVSPVSSRPIWFPMTNTTAVPAGYRADNNILVCVYLCLMGGTGGLQQWESWGLTPC